MTIIIKDNPLTKDIPVKISLEYGDRAEIGDVGHINISANGMYLLAIDQKGVIRRYKYATDSVLIDAGFTFDEEGRVVVDEESV